MQQRRLENLSDSQLELDNGWDYALDEHIEMERQREEQEQRRWHQIAKEHEQEETRYYQQVYFSREHQARLAE